MASELDALRTFLIERLLAFDSTIDTSSGSTADTEIIQPLLVRLGPDAFETPILEFLVRRAQTEFPDLVIQKGEPIYDLIFNFARMALSPYRRQISLVSNNQSIANPNTINENEADRLMANYFTSRRVGGFAVGTARIFFNQARFATVTPTQAVFTGTGLRYFPVENQSITAEQMLFNQSGSLFYFDIIVRAEEQGDEYNIEPNTLIGIENFPAVVKVQNLTRFVDGISSETTEEFFSRVEESLAERSLVVPRGIRARLFELFDTIQSIGVTGFGDVEMNRDIVTGAPDGVYAFGSLTSDSATSRLTLAPGTNLTTGIPGQTDFVTAGVAVGDTVSYLNLSSSNIEDFTVEEIVSAFQIRVSPVPPTLGTASPFWFKSKNKGQIFISDIPGGILEPQTSQGEIIVNNNQVHIGGKTDIFIRAGSPQEATITVTGIRDSEPLQLGTELETFGGDTNEFVQIFEQSTASATTDAAFTAPADTIAEILIRAYETVDGSFAWDPSQEDVGRYLELLGPVSSGNNNFGAFEITSVGDFEVVGGVLHKRITISLFNQWTNALDGAVDDHSSTAAMPYRLLEKVSVKSRVRDRSSPVQVDFNGSGQGLGASIGDSVVIETGNDAGVYTIRRILTSIGTDDTLILDRDLTSTVTPTGGGGGTGLRYRLDDEIQLDLVDPRAPKIPIGDIFPGGDLNTVANSNIVNSNNTNFLLAGVEIGDLLEIPSGNQAGLYTVTAVQANQLTLASEVPATGFNLEFNVFTGFTGIERPMVRVKEIELLDSTNQPTGVTIPYGDIIDIRALGVFGNRSQGTLVDSFRGSIDVGVSAITLNDTSVDFIVRGVTVGTRLEILEGDNIGEYEVATVSSNSLTIIGASGGDKDFASTDTDIHYNIGVTSSGVARLYFLDPTSVEIDTGISGGRLESADTTQPFGFRFSDDEGFVILPEANTTTVDTDDLRTVRSYSVGVGQFETIVELTDEGRDVYSLELREGDLLEVQEEVQFVDSSGVRLVEASNGIFGSPAGLRTTSGSALVSIPPNSEIDFSQMGDLAGQTLVIRSGPDEGTYTIRRRVDSKTLELNSVMTGSTENTIGRDSATTRDASIDQVGPSFYLVDATDVGQLPAVGDYVTIFESTNPALEGTYEVIERDIPNNRVRLATITTISGSDTFTWVSTGPNTPSNTIEQKFRIYQTNPTVVRIKQVASVGPEIKGLQTGTIAGVPPLTTITGGAGDFTGVSRGDRLEIVSGVNAGVYPIVSTTSSSATVSSAIPFNGAQVGVEYRVRGGLHGSRKMLTVEGYEGSSGLLVPGLDMPYQIRRPGVFRVSSTAMEENVDNGLYYVDIPVESLGPGDNRNLDRLSRLVATRGVRTDGYTYNVENNNLTFSNFEEVSLTFDRRILPVGNSDLPENRTEIGGRNIQITYENSPTVRTVNSFIRGDSDRVLVADPIARHFLPSFVFVTFIYEGGSSVQVVGPEMENFINSLGALDELEVSDLEAFLTRRGATSIRHPITLVTVTHDLDRNLVVERSENAVGGSDVPFNGTGRISSYFATLGEGLNLERR